MSHHSLNPRGRPIKQLPTLKGELLAQLRTARAEKQSRKFPLVEYQQDPVGFCHDILGMRCWGKQAEMLESVVQYTYTTVRSGRRTGKTIGMAALAWWRFCCFPRGQVVISSTTRDQLENLWGEVKMLHAQSGLCYECAQQDPDQPRPCPHSAIIPEPCGPTSRSGVKGTDPRYRRYILGKTARKVSAAQGFGGPECLILLDECSGISDELFAGFLGSLASGGAALLAGQPHYRHGYFYETFGSHKWNKLAISSKETPNYLSGTMEWPGLATREWVEGEISEHGEDSSHVAIHILGEFPTVSADQLFNDERVKQTLDRYPNTKWFGRLHIGIDPAGSGTEGRGDYTAIAFRRGFKIDFLTVRKGLDSDQILQEILRQLGKIQQPGEVPVINFDASGSIGKNLGIALNAHLEKHPGAFEAWARQSHGNPRRDKRNYGRHRDELAANFDRWVKEGGTFPNDNLLVQEIQLLGWSITASGKAKITDKEVYHKQLGRSPDRMDACILTCWQAPGTTFDGVVAKPRPQPTTATVPQPGLGTPRPPQGGGGVFDLERRR